jgi:hypothetical protein
LQFWSPFFAWILLSEQSLSVLRQFEQLDAFVQVGMVGFLVIFDFTQAAGDFSGQPVCRRIRPAMLGKIADTFNDIVAANEQMARQLERVGQVVGREGKTRQRVKFALDTAPGARWKRRSIH